MSIVAADPRGRGAISLVLSCLLTLLLCLWTAIHSNILEKPTKGRILTRKFTWILVGLIAPEILLWRAFEQWRDARAILAAVAGTSSNSTTHQKPRWWSSRTDSDDGLGMETAFFAVMGGFTICPIGCTNRRFTVTPSGLVRLLEEQLITPESLALRKRDIQDKAKSDAMMRILVVAQVVWMVVQCISRKVNGHSVTVIELHTLVHVVCGLGMYTLWWNKPFDAHRSIDLELDDGIAAILCYSFAPRATSRIHVSPTTPGAQRPDKPVQSPGGDHPRMAEVAGFARYGGYPARNQIGRMKGLDKSGRGVLGFAGQTLVNTEKGFFITCDSSISFVTDPVREIRFYTLLADAIRSLPVDRTVLGQRLIAVDTTDYPLRAAELRPGLLCAEASDLRSTTIASTRSALVNPVWVLPFLSLLYGGSHAAAWNSHFPTPVERLLWRVAVVVIASPVFAITLWEGEKYLVRRINASSSPVVLWMKAVGRYCFPTKVRDGDDMSPSGRELVVMFVKLVLFQAMPLLVYIAARAFVAVESFVGVRSLPGGVYDLPRWLSLWPHL